MDKLSTRKALVEARLNMPDRLVRADLLQRVMRIWLVGSTHEVIGAYWPIKGEFDPLPALYRWQEDAILGQAPGASPVAQGQAESTQLATESIASRSPRKIGLPVVNKLHKTLTFHAWYPGCPMEEDAYGIPKPKDTEVIIPTLLFVPCVGYGPGATGWAMAAVFTTARSPACSRGLSPWGWDIRRAGCRTWSPSRTTSRWTPS
jgi:5-formyltetrahydrofolate cyclo-ligase